MPAGGSSRPSFTLEHAASTEVRYEGSPCLYSLSAPVCPAGALVGAATVLYVVLPRDARVHARANGAEVKLVW